MAISGVEFVREKCKEKNVKVSKLEKDLGFANGYLNPKKLKSIPYERAILIANYLSVPVSSVLGLSEPMEYNLDPEVAQIAQELQENEDLRIIFDTTRKAKKEDLIFIRELVQRMNFDE